MQGRHERGKRGQDANANHLAFAFGVAVQVAMVVETDQVGDRVVAKIAGCTSVGHGDGFARGRVVA